jgi:DNA-binding transcriptional LysR family regulator
MRVAEVNVKLLMMFDEVYRTRNVSKAADNLELSQPSISIGLGRLRSHFGDPLFVRTSVGMEPTPHAQQIAPIVRRALEMLNQSMGYQNTFDPSSSDRHFRVCMTDITQMVILPKLLARLRVEAPRVGLTVTRIEPQTPRALESGEADFAVGFIPEIGSGFFEQTVLMRDFVCLVSVDHPRLRRSVSIAQFNFEPHVVVTASGSGLRRAEETMQARKIKRRIALRVPDLAGLDIVVAGSELIATVPRPVGQILAAGGEVKLLEHPIKLPHYPVKLHWHERFHLDPGSRWIRRIFAELLAGKGRM